MSGQNFAGGAAKRREAQQGFTLIEMSIVLVIIGLIVGGVLKGQEVVNNARLKTQVAEIDNVKAAIFNFQDKFNFLPGDLKASTVLTSATTWDGDENGTVAAAGSTTAIGDAAAIGAKMEYVWPQLQLANLITGVTNMTATSFSATTPWDYLGKIQGSFLWFGTWTITLGPGNLTGNYVRIDASSIGAAAPPSAVRNEDIAGIDLKYDDGLPDTGTIVNTQNTSCYTAGTATTAGVYVGSSTKNCIPFWGITQ